MKNIMTSKLTYLLTWLGYNASTPPLNGEEPARLMGKSQVNTGGSRDLIDFKSKFGPSLLLPQPACLSVAVCAARRFGNGLEMFEAQFKRHFRLPGSCEWLEMRSLEKGCAAYGEFQRWHADVLAPGDQPSSNQRSKQLEKAWL
jgi:hypothetical protein